VVNRYNLDNIKKKYCTGHLGIRQIKLGVRNMKKIKVTLVQALRLCTGRTVHRGSRGIAVLYRH
jgi:hypothetical protein